MIDEDFDAEAKKCGYMRSGWTTDDEATSGGYCDMGCFGGGNHKRFTLAQSSLETVYEDLDANFEF